MAMNEEVKFLEPGKMARLLSQKGPLAEIFSGFEERRGQQKLVEKISECFNESAVGVFEAATGVGKSLAYLLPGICWAFENKTRVLISTATINLQQQLIEKDAPLALRILNLPENSSEKIVLVKGRGNFICLRRFNQFTMQNELFQDEKIIEGLKRAVADENFYGSKDDLSFVVAGQTWSEICSESDNCLGNRCPFFEPCYVMKMKKKAEEAKILIANHYLLFNDLLAKLEAKSFRSTAVLPAFSHVILDEAHAIEEAARSGFSKSLNAFYLNKQLNTLYRAFGKNKLRGKKASGLLVDLITLSARTDLFTETVKMIFATSLAFTDFENCALSFVSEATTWSFLQSNENDIKKFIDGAKKFSNCIFKLNKNLSLILQNVPDEESNDAYEKYLTVYKAKVVLQRLLDIQFFFQQFENYDDLKNYIFWFEKIKTNSGNFIQFYQTPIKLDKFMQEGLFIPMDAVICTSATLQVSGRFDFTFGNLGLKNFTQKEIKVDIFDSPFPYTENVLLNIPVDAPLPNDKKFIQFACESILQLVQASQGRSLVLFTSYTMLNQVVDYVKQNLTDNKINIFYQGEYERSKLLALFKEDIFSCLFATESFWTGVDIPGESLSQVILVKLPFEVPTHPIVFAKSFYIEQQGGNSFFELSVPKAVIKFKQGFGRLMRAKTDKGVITILDNRVIKKNYGGTFIKSIPQVRKNIAPLKKNIRLTREFLS